MEYLVVFIMLVLSLFLIHKNLNTRKKGKCDKCSLILIMMLIPIISFSQETEKPFIKEHKLHKHRIDFVNSIVFQQINNYGSVYNTLHVFLTMDFTETDEIFINASVSFGNGLKKKLEREGYSISSTADDLEDDLKNINDTGRKYLMEFFYQKKIKNFVLIGGLIDAAAFIDANRYANDEHTQFLNDVFVNNPIAAIPSYNPGFHIKYNLHENISFSGVFIQNKPDKGDVGIAEIEYETEDISVRPYYFYVFGGHEHKGFGISSDYAFSDRFGVFFRGGTSNVDYNYLLSGGFETKKLITDDKVGMGAGFIKGKAGVENIYVCECYYTVNLNKHLYISGDLQYIKEKKENVALGGRVYFSY